MDSISAKILLVLAGLLILGNTAVSTFLLAERFSGPTPTPVVAIPTATPSPGALVALPATGSADLSVLTSAVSELQQRVQDLEDRPTAPASSTAPVAKARETYLYLGSGNTFNREWTTIDSAAVTLDTAQYGEIVEVRFEAALSIISGEVYARLAEKGTSAVFYQSVLTHNRSTSEWKTSAVVPLLSGKHTYVVQLRSSNGEKANLDGARLKILAR